MSSHNVVELPSSQEIEQARESSRTLAKYASQERVTMTVTGENGESEDIVLPGHLMEMLIKILTVTSLGKAINIMPINSELTTQEAANMMNVSRPHIVKLLDQDTIAHHKVGSHRRIYLKDLLEYMEKNRSARSEALDELTALSQDLGLY